MILNFLRLFHAVFGIVGIGTGLVVLTRMVSRSRFERTASLFLKCSLAASATGLFFSVHHLSIMQLAAMLGVYLSGIVVLAWRKVHLDHSWAPALVLSIVSVLCLDCLIAIAHLFRFLALFNSSDPAHPGLLFLVTVSAVTLLFAVLGMVAVKKQHRVLAHSVAHKVAG
jgi:hypothetical protein